MVNRLFTDFDPRGRGCKTFGTRLNEPTRVPSGVCTIQDIDIGPFPRGPGSFYYAASGTRFRGLAQFQVHDAPETPCQLLPKIFAKKWKKWFGLVANESIDLSINYRLFGYKGIVDDRVINEKNYVFFFSF